MPIDPGKRLPEFTRGETVAVDNNSPDRKLRRANHKELLRRVRDRYESDKVSDPNVSYVVRRNASGTTVTRTVKGR